MLFLFLVALRFCFCGRANARIGRPRAAVIMQTAKLGDMVCTTPMFRAFKKAYPEARLIVVGDGVNKALLEGNGDVDEYIVYDKHPFALIRLLRKRPIDFGCTAIPGPDTLAMLYLSGIPLIAAPAVVGGFSPLMTRAYRFFLRAAVMLPHRMGHYAPREYLRLLEPLGIRTDDTRKRLALRAADSAAADAFLGGQHLDPRRDLLVGIAPSSGYKIKCWDPEKFARVAEYVSRRYGARVLVLGATGDREEVAKMLGALSPEAGAIDASMRFDLGAFKALVSRLALLIGVDTGPVYVAEAFGVATVDIVGPMDEREQPPAGPLHRLVYLKDRKAPEIHILNVTGYNEAEARRQSGAITVEMVTAEIDALMPLIASRRLHA